MAKKATVTMMSISLVELVAQLRRITAPRSEAEDPVTKAGVIACRRTILNEYLRLLALFRIPAEHDALSVMVLDCGNALEVPHNNEFLVAALKHIRAERRRVEEMSCGFCGWLWQLCEDAI